MCAAAGVAAAAAAASSASAAAAAEKVYVPTHKYLNGGNKVWTGENIEMPQLLAGCAVLEKCWFNFSTNCCCELGAKVFIDREKGVYAMLATFTVSR